MSENIWFGNIGKKTFGFEVSGRETFGMKVSGRKAFGSQVSDEKTFESEDREGQKHLKSRRLCNRILAQ